MLERVRVVDFQSLHDVEVPLGKFTVILGDSSSGKSAFIRALHALAFNIRGTSHVTFGKKYSIVRGELPEWAIEVYAGANKYIVYDRNTDTKLPVFDKLNGSVPSKVQEILQLKEANFAGQFDKPYLLSGVPASQVAKVLGDLTNVSTIFEAVSVGNKRRLALSAELKTRKADLESARRELDSFQDLPVHIQHVDRMESLLADVESLTERSKALSLSVQSLEEAHYELNNSRIYPDVPEIDYIIELSEKRIKLSNLFMELSESMYLLESSAVYPDVPDLQEIIDLQERRNTLSSLINGVSTSLADMQQAKDSWSQADMLESRYEQELHDLLVEAGTCPTCNQSIPNS